MGSPVVMASNNTLDSAQTPASVTYNGKKYNIAREGTAEILDLQRQEAPKTFKGGAQSVFYNPIQQYNRDLSVLAIKVFGEDLAAIRKARHQRRIAQLAKGQQPGQKRSRTDVEDTGNGQDPGAKRQKTDGPTVSLNGHSDSLVNTEQGVRPEKPVSTSSTEQQNNPQKPPDSETKGQSEGLISANDGKPPFRILDALSATGLRALRYAREMPMVTSVTANDLSTHATASIKLNIEHNKLAEKVCANRSDAVEHMHHAASHDRRTETLYQVVDLDPYGTAAPFLDAAVQALSDGGMLCVTCTDAGVFASVGYLEKTYSQYGGLPLKGPHAHEGGLRLILHAIATSAARYGLAIEPLLSLSIDFYARVFVRIHRSPVEVKFLASKTMIVYSCDTGCGAWSTQFLARPNKKEARNGDIIYSFTQAVAPSAGTNCEHCGFKTHLAGPMWGGPLHNPHFIQRILDMLPTLDKSLYGTIPRIEGMLSIALNEMLDDAPSAPAKGATSTLDRPIPPTDPANRSHHPFFFLPPALSRVLHCVCPSDAAVRGALLHLGYRVTRSHTKAGSICTDAPWSIIWEVMREWIRQKSPVKEGAVKERTAGWGIMQKDRSKVKLNEARELSRQVVDNTKLRNIGELRRDMEAALYRLSKLEEELTESENPKSINEQEVVSPDAGESEKVHVNGVAKHGERIDGYDNGRTPTTGAPKIVFDEQLGREPQTKGMVRYQINPRPDWGPMNRAKGDS